MTVMGARTEHLRVIVAHADAGRRESVARLLRDNDIDVVDAVAGGDAAVQAVLELEPDLVLVGVEAGGHAGFDSARRLTETPSGSPVVMFGSADAERELGDRFPTGAAGYLRTDVLAERLDPTLRIAIALFTRRCAPLN